ncbi:hypothetical protein CEN45_09365 [Fischerella thermalis CCMEE 5198]|jgi:hypothetical protein|uniref:DUF2281 domain-containing protein n=1 Tax=Fischerella thermalis CCMEE 5330 TaxID=2019670 RepID=A0A2N6MMR1_9CYAN|nr:DUF2281 domain-containing protein [Fischerella thermalis]PMB06862.1 hypothetical protein CI594_01295 [Fischerella thermalis CCMEE 5196]PMB23921.1 hypothetical protein CEN45_09365 [Fischerella thermalis CCMEE 5198]PMB48037.1 hypothetical protein CEN41_02440 [Fischerella thermalis CCMEE 5330]
MSTEQLLLEKWRSLPLDKQQEVLDFVEFLEFRQTSTILLKPKKSFPATTLDDVAGCLKYQGTAKTIEDMDNAIRQGVEESWHDRS